MKIINKHFKIISLLFAILILFQGCTVYKSTNVSLDDASKMDLKVRIKKMNGEKEKYSRIVILNDGQYYGKKKVRDKIMYNYVLIDENDIQKVQVSDKNASTLMSVFVPVLIIGLTIGGIALGLERMPLM